MTRQQQVVIVGGGVIGLLTAYNLASEVRSVVRMPICVSIALAAWQTFSR